MYPLPVLQPASRDTYSVILKIDNRSLQLALEQHSGAFYSQDADFTKCVKTTRTFQRRPHGG